MAGQKHAYLLMIHEYTETLTALLKLLDDSRNDIFIHIDRKSRSFPTDQLLQKIHFSQVFFVRRMEIHWGTNSIAKCEIRLLKTALKHGPYQYYHLLSGADLPLKTQDELHDWFDKHAGKEFIHFGTESYQRDIACRYQVFHFFTKQIGRKRDKPFWLDVETYSLAIQRRLHIDRIRHCGLLFFGGANWFSITDDFAKEVIRMYAAYKSHFYFTQNSDELIIQTMVMNSSFSNNLFLPGFSNDYAACARLIDWDRGAPYCYQLEDFDELMSSEACFARKFDDRVDAKIVHKIYETLTTENDKKC